MAKASPDDWRRTGQERDLANCVFTWREYRAPNERWDHDHCEFCWEKFMVGPNAPPDALAAGYRTEARGQERWVCPKCFEDFREEFGFILQPHGLS